MADKTPQSPSLPPDISERLHDFEIFQSFVDAGVAAYDKYLEIMTRVDTARRFEKWELENPYYFVLAALHPDTELHLENRERHGLLRRKRWANIDAPETLQTQVMWTRKFPRCPVFIGSSVQVDYIDPYKTAWVYQRGGKVRAKVKKGLKFAVRTTTQVEELYTL